MEHPRLRQALDKVLLELSNSILKRRAFNKLVSIDCAHGLNFFRVAAAALQNDLYAGAHRALDQSSDSTSIWYVSNLDRPAFLKALHETGVDEARLKDLAAKLKVIRDRVHFHSDRRSLDDASAPWQEAGLTGDEFIELTESAHTVMAAMKQDLTGEEVELPGYQGNDIEFIIRAYAAAHPTADVSI